MGYKMDASSIVLLMTSLSTINLKELYLDNTKIDASIIKDFMNSWQL